MQFLAACSATGAIMAFVVQPSTAADQRRSRPMPNDQPVEQPKKPEQAPVEREPYIPRPPTREELEQIGREQALITDEWTGEQPQRDR
jgi:hypothetical protein